ncbi:helix-turn-helix domain-containing protein [Micromonospora purpureochromogenes]|uniref:Transcriptional regulator n=1 Tax=Micromonospora purpureochromogenes TaxID=47872 RepID=A0ABX2RSS3_9ACTN|nr:helix-turn-helix domain-containing protein [Micromonospora purpureochromogenes]NYF58284.1 putative transcriptional regulator [Micromonospora purpureochromogenes]
MLAALGLEPAEEAVYRALLNRPSATTVRIAKILELAEPDAATALARLEDVGLVNRDPTGAYRATPPAVGLGALITERRDSLRMAEHALVTLAEEHRAAVAGRTIGELIEVVTGVDAIRHRFLQLQQAARTQLRLFITAPFVAVPPGENTAEPAAVERGIRFRAVLERAVLEQPGHVEETVDSLGRGVELRVVDELPMKLAIADADLALVPLAVAPGGEPGAVLLHRSGLLTAMEALFDAVWQRAHPLELSTVGAGPAQLAELATDAPTDLDRKIIALLLAGLTDQAVATQLDLSLRTLQRRLRHLMDTAGVRTRMQLSWYAVQNGWVGRA